MNRSRSCSVLAISLALAVPASASADWNEPVGGPSPINHSSTRSADAVSLTEVGGIPYVTWNEDNTAPGEGSSSQIRVARLAADGLSWEKIGNTGSHPISRLSSTSSHDPDIADVDGTPWVAWSEGVTQTNSEIRAARYDAATGSWVRVVDTDRPINHLKTGGGGQANYPSIADGGGGRPYVSFFEADPGSGSLFFPGSEPAKVWVVRLNAAGTAWEEVGGGPVSNPDFDAAFPRMTTIAGVPWLTYFQVNVVGGSPELQIQAARLSSDGQSWEHIGPLTTAGPGDVDNPDIASIGGRPHVAFGDTQGGSAKRIRVFALNAGGDGWDEQGSAPASPEGVDADSAGLAEIEGQPWVSWQASGGPSGTQLAVARLDGGEWETVGGPVTSGSGQNQIRFGPSLASINGFPWVGFGLDDGASQGGPGVPPCCSQVRVSRLEPEFAGSQAQAESTSATLLTTAETYDLPFPIGFEYGPRTDLDRSTPAEAAFENPAVVLTGITGLTPSSLYGFRPYATAGTPQPRALGPSELFLTESEQAGGGDPLLAAIIDHRKPLVRGKRLRVHFLSSKSAEVRLEVTRRGVEVAETVKQVGAGRRAIVWSGNGADGEPAPTGRYRLALIAETATGETVRDKSRVRVVRRR